MVLRRAASLSLVLAALASAAAADVNRIVLRVNDRIATLYEYEQRRASRARDIQRADLSPERRQRLLADIGVQTMREMYEELLVLSRADQLDMRVSSAEVDAAVEQAKGSFDFQSDEEFLAALASSGMTLEDLRRQMERNLLIRQVMGREVQSQIEIEEEDQRRFYRQHADEFTTPRRIQVREIVVPDAADPDVDRRLELAAEVRQALLGGPEGEERLGELADSGQATGLIDLGWVERGDLEAALERVVWELEAGRVSAPVAARGGLHVLEVVSVEEATLKPFAEVQEAIDARLRSERFDEAMSGFLDDLEQSSYIKASPPPEAADFRAVEAPDTAGLDELGLGATEAETTPDAAPDEPQG